MSHRRPPPTLIVPSDVRPRQLDSNRPMAAAISWGSAIRPTPDWRQLSQPAVGVDNVHPVIAQLLDVALHGGMLPHSIVHRRGQQDRSGETEIQRREQIVGQTVGQFARDNRPRPGRCRAIGHRVANWM